MAVAVATIGLLGIGGTEMSPLFGKRDDGQKVSLSVGSRDLERAAQSEPGLDAEVARLEALSLLELAAEVMTKALTYTSEPDTGPYELFNVARVLAPPEYRDEAESDRRMRDLVGEGVQVLEQARLVRSDAWSTGQNYHVGYITTRLGRAAVEANAVERILGGGSL
jgi:hypothetical protein